MQTGELTIYSPYPDVTSAMKSEWVSKEIYSNYGILLEGVAAIT
jgi:hypothetical protein